MSYEIFLFFYFLEESIESWCNFFLKCLEESTSSTIQSWFLQFGRLLLVIGSISLIDMGLFILFTCSVWVFEVCVFKKLNQFTKLTHLWAWSCSQSPFIVLLMIIYLIHGDNPFISDITDCVFSFYFPVLLDINQFYCSFQGTTFGFSDLPASGITCFSFSRFSQWKLRLLISDLFFNASNSINFPFKNCCHSTLQILMLYFHFHLV